MDRNRYGYSKKLEERDRTHRRNRSASPSPGGSFAGPPSPTQDTRRKRDRSPRDQPVATSIVHPFKYTSQDLPSLGLTTPGDILAWSTSPAVLIPLRAFKDLVITKPANQTTILQLKRYTELLVDINAMSPSKAADWMRPWARFRRAVIARTLHNLSDRNALGPGVIGAVPGLDNDALRGDNRAALAFPWIRLLDQMLTNSYLAGLLKLNYRGGAAGGQPGGLWPRAAAAAFDLADAVVHDLYPDLGRVDKGFGTIDPSSFFFQALASAYDAATALPALETPLRSKPGDGKYNGEPRPAKKRRTGSSDYHMNGARSSPADAEYWRDMYVHERAARLEEARLHRADANRAEELDRRLDEVVTTMDGVIERLKAPT